MPDSALQVARKLFLMESLAVYWNCGGEPKREAFSGWPDAQKLGLFRQSFGGTPKQPVHDSPTHDPPPSRTQPSYILEPFTSTGRVTINKQVTDDAGDLARPRHAVVLDVDVIPLKANPPPPPPLFFFLGGGRGVSCAFFQAASAYARRC